MHYMVHNPECIERFGPQVRSWCMRFEGKHSYFKDLAHRVRCYKNIPKALAKRHQYMMAYTFGTASISSTPFGKDVLVGVSTVYTLASYSYRDQVHEIIPDEAHFNSLSWIELCGTHYSAGDVVAMDSNLLPKFGVIRDIIIDSVQAYYFILEVLHTICFVPHYHSYEVSYHVPSFFELCKPSNLVDPCVLSLYQIPYSQSFFVPLKYFLVESI